MIFSDSWVKTKAIMGTYGKGKNDVPPPMQSTLADTFNNVPQFEVLRHREGTDFFIGNYR